MKFSKTTRGFTLIELLVVISIVGMLASTVLASVKPVIGKARDAERLSDLRQIMIGLQMFHDRYGHYPCYAYWASGVNSPDDETYHWSWSPDFMNVPPTNIYLQQKCIDTGSQGLVADGFLSQVPRDPLTRTGNGNGTYHEYVYEAPNDAVNGPQTYILYAKLEQDTDRMANDGGFCAEILELGPGVGVVHATSNVIYLIEGRYVC